MEIVTDLFNKFSISRAARIANSDAIEGHVLPSKTCQANTDRLQISQEIEFELFKSVADPSPRMNTTTPQKKKQSRGFVYILCSIMFGFMRSHIPCLHCETVILFYPKCKKPC